MTEGWRFEWVEGLDAVLSPPFAAAWEGLVARAGNRHVFQEPLIARAWLESKGSTLGVQPRFCLASHDSGAAVLVPFCEMPHGYRNAWRRRLISVGEPHFDYQDPPAAWPAESPSPWPGFWTILTDELARPRRWEHAMILRIGPRSAPVPRTADGSQESPFIRLEGSRDLDDVLGRRSANHRTDVRRRLRRLHESGSLSLHVYSHDEGAAAGEELDRFREAYERLWRNTPSQDLFRKPGTFAFYRRLLEVGLPAGLVHFSVQRVGERPISWHFGFLHLGVLHWYKPTYEPEFESYSPGKAHLAQLIGIGTQRGWREIDLGGGTEAYKYAWADEARPLSQWQWHAATWRGRACRLAQRAHASLTRRAAGPPS